MNSEISEVQLLTPQITKNICSNLCKSKCCNMLLSGHYIPIEIWDYYRLKLLNFEKCITYYSSVERPQLMRKINGDCIFLHPENRTCTIYKMRPQTCRIFPFIDNNLKIPKFCLLFYETNEQLHNLQLIYGKDIEFEDQNIKIPEEIIVEYILNDSNNQGVDHFDIKYQEIYESASSFFMVKFNSHHQKNEFNYFISNLKEKYHELDWYICRLWYFNKKFKFICQIEGIYTSKPDMEIPYVQNFPPTNKEFETLFKLSMENEKQKNHVLFGAVLQSELLKTIKHIQI